MTLETLKNRSQGFMDDVRIAAVMVLLIEVEDEIHVVFEERAHHLKRQPGEISLPGGMVEPGESYAQAAIRECCEELLITENEVEVLAPLDYLITPFSMVISPWLARFKGETLGCDPQEVASVFTIPLKDILKSEPTVYRSSLTMTPAEDFPFPDYPFLPMPSDAHFYAFGEHIIWGMTAKILTHLKDILCKTK